MTADDVERDIQRVAAEWAFIQSADTMDKAEHTVKMRLHVDADCFVQVYVNTQKQLTAGLLRTSVESGPPGSTRQGGH